MKTNTMKSIATFVNEETLMKLEKMAVERGMSIANAFRFIVVNGADAFASLPLSPA